LEPYRNLANAHALIGYGKLFVGDAEETESHIAEALRLSPRDPEAFLWMSYAGMSKNKPGSYELAVAWFRRSLALLEAEMVMAQLLSRYTISLPDEIRKFVPTRRHVRSPSGSLNHARAQRDSSRNKGS
jgi:hypothetical protein